MGTGTLNDKGIHQKEKEMLTPGIIQKIQKSYNPSLTADAICGAGKIRGCAILDLMNPIEQLFIFLILKQRAREEAGGLEKSTAQTIITHAEILELPVVAGFEEMKKELSSLTEQFV